MIKELKQVYDDSIEPFDERTINVFSAGEDWKIIPQLDKLFKSYNSSASKLEYLGMSELSAVEEANLVIEKPNHPIVYAATKTYTTILKLHIKYDGVLIDNLKISPPFIDEEGCIVISGTKYNVIPILTDRVISAFGNTVMIKVSMKKIIVKSTINHVVKNNTSIPTSVKYTEDLIQVKGTGKLIGKIVTPLLLYLFIEKGFMDTFSDRCGIDPILFDTTDIDKYRDNYDIYRNVSSRPPGLKTNGYKASTVCVGLPKGTTNIVALELVYAYLYILRHTPEVADNTVIVIHGRKRSTEINYWKNIMVTYAFNGSYTLTTGLQAIDIHLASIINYLDVVTQHDLRKINVNLNNFFDVISYTIEQFDTLVTSSRVHGVKNDTRYLEVMYYLLNVYMIGINKIMREVVKNDTKSNTPVYKDRIKKLFNTHLAGTVIFKLTGNGTNLCLQYADDPTDNRLIRSALPADIQGRGMGVNQPVGSHTFPRNLMTLSAWDIFYATVNNAPKSVPTILKRLSPFAHFDDNGVMVLTKQDRFEQDVMDDYLSGKLEADSSLTAATIDSGDFE